jgi:hypothetical protein
MQPVVFEWREVEVSDPKTGEVSKTFAMVPLERFLPTAKRQFQTEQKYRPGDWIVGEDVRSTAQHKRYFAALREAFDQLPETIARRWPTSEHFRHWLLIEANWKDEKEINCEDETHAKRLATFVRTETPFARITVATNPRTGKKTIVVIERAMSQDYSAMDKETFKRSSDDVLDLAATLFRCRAEPLLKTQEPPHEMRCRGVSTIPSTTGVLL